MNRLTVECIIALHEEIINASGGLPGVRSMELLESAVFSSFQTFDGIDLYPTIEEKAANLCYSLIKNHAFHDGNKRVGVLALLVFLKYNSMEVKCSDSDLISLGIRTAAGTYSQRDVLQWIKRVRLSSDLEFRPLHIFSKPEES